ncbi:MAG TPA: isoprenylcysteine carboxylmethyltransferase family protein [Terracidiphilus sp.]|jgi:protein-S-isoprenylcysteine O-methyltransferase Ste14
MKDLHRKALIGILRTLVPLIAIVFGPAWTFRYWQGWLCLFSFFVPACLITVYVARNDPALLERRLKAGPKAEKEKGQKIVQAIASIVFLADFAVPAFDYRFHWSSIPAYVCIAGDVMMIVGFVIVFEVFKANSFTSGIIEVSSDQKVISTGPYALVRHPMYDGGLLLLYGIPLALGSAWGTLVNIPMTAAVVWRLLDEEKFLIGNLPGYSHYRETVRYRLLPYIW